MDEVDMNTFNRLRLILGTMAMMVAATAYGQDCWPPIACKVIPKSYAYQLEVVSATSVAPGPNMIEHQPITIAFHLQVNTYGLGPELQPTNIRVCPKFQREGTSCKDFVAKAGRTFSGEVTALAPAAGIAAPISLVVLQEPQGPGEHYAWDERAEESLRVPVAAQYEIALEEFEILHTRSATTDTVWANLQGLIKSSPTHPSDDEAACKNELHRWCVIGVKYGDAQDGVHQLQGMRVGPFELVPEREEKLRFLYTIYNYGDSYYQKLGQAVADGFSKVGMIVLMAYGVQSGSSDASLATQLDQGMQQLHAAEFAGCDGLSVVDARDIDNRTIDTGNATLDGVTRDSGVYRPDFTSIYEGEEYTDGNTRCGAGGKYRVRYVIYRTSWRDWN